MMLPKLAMGGWVLFGYYTLYNNREEPVMPSRWPLLFALIHIAGFSGAVSAKTLDRERCDASDPDLIISGCTAVIKSGQEKPQNLASAFFNRAVAYLSKDQYDPAIRDFGQPIRLNLSNAEYF